MNILFYYTKTITPKHGGIARVTLSLANQFRIEGHNVYCLSSKKTNNDEDKEQHYLPQKTKVICEENKKYFIKFIKDHSINIIINQNGTTPIENEAIMWGHEINIPIITVLHSSLFGIYGIHQNKLIKYLPLIKFFKADKILNRITHYYFKCKYGKYYKEQVRKCAQIVLLSKYFFPEIKYFSGIESDNITHISNPLTVNHDYNDKTTKEKELLYVGRISYEKRVDLLLKIWKKIQHKYPDWKLTIIGDGPLKHKIELMANKLQLQRISFKGYKDPNKYYKRASIFCMTSAFEGFGLVLIEAMKYGTVPLAFNSYANVSEIIDNNENGFLIPPFSIDKYVTQLSFLIENNNKRKIMGEKAIIKSDNFKIEAVSNEWNTLFKSILNNH